MGQHNEVHRYIPSLRSLDGVAGLLIQKQQLSRLQMHRRTAADEVGCLTGAHIHDLHIVVAVTGKGYEPGMGAYGDELALAQQLGRIDLKPMAGGIQCPV